MAYCLGGGIVLGKILPTTFCYGSGAQRHILPHTVIGAATGAFVSLLSTLGLISPDFVPQFVICAMRGGMLAAAMRTPILAILLVLEMTNSFSNIYAIGTVTLVAYLVADLLKNRRFTIPCCKP